jgi:cell wall-associated NlpC family hydrolase
MEMHQDQGSVNVSVANVYRYAAYDSEVISQALLGEPISILKKEKSFTRVQLPDGYQGWISNYQWVTARDTDLVKKRVRTHFLRIFEGPLSNSRQIRDATIGVDLNIADVQNGWVRVILPDGKDGWVKQTAFATFPPKTREAAVQLAEEFLGYSYCWGGRSTKGFDCSGLTQSVFRLIGVEVPRDAWMQHQEATFVSDKPGNARQGDLYFFSDNGSKITHVGIVTNPNRMIHSRGMVRYNSLINSDEDFCDDLHNTFVDVRTFFKL